MTAVLSFLFSPIGRYVLIGFGCFIALWFYGAKKEREGYEACKVEWRAAEAKAQQTGRDARNGADSDVRGGVPDHFDRDDN